MKIVCLLVSLLGAAAQAAPLPPRPGNAPGGRELAARLKDAPLAEREAAVREQFLAGNVPDSWRKFAEVKITRTIAGQEHTAVLRVAPDYLTIGSDADALLMPLSPSLAAELAAHLDCSLPTPRMVDEIHRAAAVQLTPRPFPPGPAMTTMTEFARHSELVRKQVPDDSRGALLAGHKKDLVLTPRMLSAPGKVAIYGWHQADGAVIQPLHLGHSDSWVDYSHGVRLVANPLTLDGKPASLTAVLTDPVLAELLSSEGPFDPAPVFAPPWPPERSIELHLEAGVRAVINAPAQRRPERPLQLVIYAAPAGNTIEQTFGRRIHPGGDWHYDIQHLTAQTRWLRRHQPGTDLAVAVVQCAEKSWPAWRRARDPDNRRIPGIVAAIRDQLDAPGAGLILSGHSAGGSFVFGYLDAVPRIPDEITRLCFLDSNYAYSAAKDHHTKLAAWLRGDRAPRLCVIAYHDSAARLDGRPFVSEDGGTWGRSHAMLRELPFAFTLTKDGEWRRHSALDGRVQILLRENPRREVLHTRLVEGNGFIHSLLTGTPAEENGYHCSGPRAYESFIPSAK